MEYLKIIPFLKGMAYSTRVAPAFTPNIIPTCA